MRPNPYDKETGWPFKRDMLLLLRGYVEVSRGVRRSPDSVPDPPPNGCHTDDLWRFRFVKARENGGAVLLNNKSCVIAAYGKHDDKVIVDFTTGKRLAIYPNAAKLSNDSPGPTGRSFSRST